MSLKCEINLHDMACLYEASVKITNGCHKKFEKKKKTVTKTFWKTNGQTDYDDHFQSQRYINTGFETILGQIKTVS